MARSPGPPVLDASPGSILPTSPLSPHLPSGSLSLERSCVLPGGREGGKAGRVEDWPCLTCMGREHMLVSTSFRAREYLSSPNISVRLF